MTEKLNTVFLCADVCMLKQNYINKKISASKHY